MHSIRKEEHHFWTPTKFYSRMALAKVEKVEKDGKFYKKDADF